MNLIFIILMTFFLFITVIVANYNVLSPSVQTWLLFWFVSCVFYVFAGVWGIEIMAKTMILIIGGLFSFLLGEKFCRASNAYAVKHIEKTEIDSFYCFSQMTILGMLFVGGYAVYNEYKTMLSIARRAGYAGGSFVLNYARKAYLFDDVDNNVLLSIINYFVIAYGYICLTMLIRDLVFLGKKGIKKRYFLGLLPIILLFILGTGRTGFLQLLMFGFSITLICFLKKNGSVSIHNKKVIKIASGIVIVTFALFILLGMLTGKTQRATSVSHIVGDYLGSSIAGLDSWLGHRTSLGTSDKLIGENSFRSLYLLIGRFIDIKVGSSVMEFVGFKNGDTTNVYTAFREYYDDFGMIGVFVFEFLMGFFLTHLLGKALKEHGIGINAIIYAYFSYGILRQITAAHFISAYFNIQFMFVLIFMIIIMRWVRVE